MNVIISGKNMETGTALKNHVEDHLKTSVQKYFDDAINAKIVFSKSEHSFKCHITVNEGVKDGIVITAEDDDGDIYGAFNSTLQKAEKQLRRYKRKLKDRSKKESLSELSAKAANS